VKRVGFVILGAVADEEASKADEPETISATAAEAGQKQSFGELRYYVPQDLLDVSFPVSVRGYDRGAVDAYVKRVNRVIAELKVRGSPPAAVRHALEQAEEKVQGLLRAAREAAAEITASAQREGEESSGRAKAEAAELIVHTSDEADRVRAEADEFVAKARAEADGTVARAKAEADEMLAEASAEAQSTVARAEADADERRQLLEEELAALRQEAEARMREIEADTEAVWTKRDELLDGIGRTAGGLVDLANAAAAAFQRQSAGPEEEMLEAEAGAESEPRAVATDQSARATPAVALEKGGNGESREQVAEGTATAPDT
jgi:DivIVA domain-containing protein